MSSLAVVRTSTPFAKNLARLTPIDHFLAPRLEYNEDVVVNDLYNALAFLAAAIWTIEVSVVYDLLDCLLTKENLGAERVHVSEKLRLSAKVRDLYLIAGQLVCRGYLVLCSAT